MSWSSKLAAISKILPKLFLPILKNPLAHRLGDFYWT